MPPPPTLPDFALAKIQPPRQRIDLIERPALERSLGEALLQQRLVLLVAPAGYGKTAALARQIRQLPAGCALAWVCADEDDQLQRFLACLCTALEPYDLPWRVAPDALPKLAQSDRGVRAAAVELVNALAAAEVAHGLIVLDDLHRINDPHIFELLQSLIERLPLQWTLVISSRTEPRLSLARLRVAGELAEFRQDELRFGAGEVAALLAGLPAGTTTPDALELLQRTEGWPVGLRLLLNAQAGGGASSRHLGAAAPSATAAAGLRGTLPPLRLTGAPQRHLFDYLAAEVLDDMSAELRQFLLRCSVLPELTAARCRHVSGMAQADRLLDELERRSLFVSVLQADELTLRLHDLVRDFLQDRLQRDHATALPGLLKRAAVDEPDLQRAVGWLARAGAWDEAEQALRQRGPPLFMRGAGPALEQMLTLFPPAELHTRADLQLLRGLAALQHLDFDTLLDAMHKAAAGYTRAGRDRDAVLAHAYACMGLQHTARFDEAARDVQQLRALPLDDDTRAFVQCAGTWTAYARAEAEDVAPLYAGMLDALERIDDVTLWHRCAIVSVLIGLPGMRPLLQRFASGALRLCGDTPSELQCSAMHIHAWLAIGQGRLDEAWNWLARADDTYRWLGMTRGVSHSNGITHVLLRALRGERQASHAAAQRLTHDLHQHSPASHRRTSEYLVLAAHSQASWLLQDAHALRAIDAALARAANPFEWRVAPLCRQLSESFVALLDERLDDARALLEPLAGDVNRGTYFPADQSRMLLADVALRQGRHDEAAGLLRAWCEAARTSGEVGGALFAGQPVLQRLASADWGGRLAATERDQLVQLSALLNASQAAPPPQTSGPLPAAAEAVRPDAAAAHSAHAANESTGLAAPRALSKLSERELEVLERIAHGDSNKLIARAFSLSPHTVKRHVANILDKLDVDTRGQAAACWRERAR